MPCALASWRMAAALSKRRIGPAKYYTPWRWRNCCARMKYWQGTRHLVSGNVASWSRVTTAYIPASMHSIACKSGIKSRYGLLVRSGVGTQRTSSSTASRKLHLLVNYLTLSKRAQTFSTLTRQLSIVGMSRQGCGKAKTGHSRLSSISRSFITGHFME